MAFDGVSVFSSSLSENQIKSELIRNSAEIGDRDEFGDKVLFYTVSWLAKPKYVNGFFPSLQQPLWSQFTGNAREVYATIQWIKAEIDRGNILDAKVERLIRDRKAAVENGYHWHTINGVPEFHSWDDCPENLEDWLDYKDEQ